MTKYVVSCERKSEIASFLYRVLCAQASFSVRYILRFDGRRESVCTYVRANPSHNYVCVIYRIADIYNIFFYCRFIYEMNKWSCPITINCICAKIVLSIANVGELDAISLVWRIIRIATYLFRLRLLSIIIRTHSNRGREMVISTQALYSTPSGRNESYNSGEEFKYI